MLKIGSLLISVFFTQFGYANSEMLCIGKFSQGNISHEVELFAQDRLSQNILEGTLPTTEGAIDFYVRKQEDGYYYRVQKQEPGYLWMSEQVDKLPAVRSKQIGPNEKVSIDCRPYSFMDYCRLHTC